MTWLPHVRPVPALSDWTPASFPGFSVAKILGKKPLDARSPSPRAWRPDFPGAAREAPCKSRTWLSDFTFTFHFHALEKEMAAHSSVLAWRIPGILTAFLRPPEVPRHAGV